MKKVIIIILFLIVSGFVLLAYTNSNKNKLKSGNNPYQINENGMRLQTRYPTPPEFRRLKCRPNSFADYLRNIELKPYGAIVKYFNGLPKFNLNVYDGVLDIDIGDQNLQQCADAIIRLRAEYLFANDKYADIHFNLTNGFRVDYSKWIQGYRIKISGNKSSWTKTAVAENSYKIFRQYLDLIFNYAGTRSLSKELKPRKIQNMQIGDVFIKAGTPGHAILVVDMIENIQTRQKYYMIIQSYMPAQDIQILVNRNSDTHTVWYRLDIHNTTIDTPEWDFTSKDLKYFQ